MAQVVGRDAELAAGEAFLDAVTAGRAALVLEGEAGIGKTTVWGAIAASARARGFVVLATRPVEAEAELTLSAVADLLDAVPEDVVQALPDPQRHALDAALLRASPSVAATDPRLLGTAVRGVLARLAAATPVLLAIDDVQWADAASVATLAYGLRRADGARVGTLLAHRTGLPMPLSGDALGPAERTTVVGVGPVSVATLHHMLKARMGQAPPRSLLIRIHEAARGNPLFALEIARLMDELGPADPALPLPVSRDVRGLVRRRLRRLPPDTRDLLLLASAAAVPTLDVLRDAAGRDVGPDVDVAVDADVARTDGSQVSFAHPLFAGAIYADAGDAARRDAHARLAGAVSDPEERARHRALASDAPDAAVAAGLDAAAATALARGAPTAAVQLIELALARTPADDADQRLDRSIRLGELLWRAGDPMRAAAILTAAIDAAGPGQARARAGLALVSVLNDAEVGPSAAEAAKAALEDARGNPELEALAHALIAAVAYEDLSASSMHAREAHRLLGEVADPDPRIAAVVLHRWVGAPMDDGAPVPWADIERALEYERRDPQPSVGDRVSASIGPILLADDDLERARTWTEATLAACLEEGDEGSLPYALGHVARLELVAGDWDRAERLAREQLHAAVAAGLGTQRSSANHNLGMVAAYRGDLVAAHEALEEVLATAVAAGDTWMHSNVLGLLGSVELAAGEARRAASLLVDAEALRRAITDPRPRRTDGDLVESLVAIGDLARADEHLAAVEARAARFNRATGLGIAARARALVRGARGDVAGGVVAAREAVDRHVAAPSPYERARSLLVLGALLRRNRERTAARDAFADALAVFERLGAQAWAARARAELERVGIRRASPDELTEGERRVAELVAAGMTNRDVAAALFVSPKTVEANLGRVYAKLGVRSRAELGARMGEAGRAQT